jgi:ABC-type multidrug transport system fused ATPase/permease subunit
VGPSGFGKTTLLQLLFRMYDPEQGRVTIDGQDLKECKMDSFRRLITVIPQNGVLFNDTVRFNLQYGNPDATQEEIEAIAKKCHLHEKIMSMPDGYDS